MYRYHLLKDRFNIRSIRHIYQRFFAIYNRYGLNTSHFSKTLIDFVNFFNRYSIKLTLPVTALVLKKNYSLFRQISMKVDFAMHGHIHVDYTHLDHDVVRNHLHKGRRIFNQCGFWNFGFRFPYLGRNDQLINMCFPAASNKCRLEFIKLV